MMPFIDDNDSHTGQLYCLLLFYALFPMPARAIIQMLRDA